LTFQILIHFHSTESAGFECGQSFQSSFVKPEKQIIKEMTLLIGGLQKLKVPL